MCIYNYICIYSYIQKPQNRKEVKEVQKFNFQFLSYFRNESFSLVLGCQGEVAASFTITSFGAWCLSCAGLALFSSRLNLKTTSCGATDIWVQSLEVLFSSQVPLKYFCETVPISLFTPFVKWQSYLGLRTVVRRLQLNNNADIIVFGHG